MRMIGRKLYAWWGENLVMGFEKRVVPPASLGLFEERGKDSILHDVVDFDGERILRPVGAPAGSTYGHSVNDLIQGNQFWLTAAEAETADWEEGGHRLQGIGRKLSLAWSDRMVVGIEKLVIDPASLDLQNRNETYATLVDIIDVMGEATERPVGRPADAKRGAAANELFTAPFAWVTAEEADRIRAEQSARTFSL